MIFITVHFLDIRKQNHSSSRYSSAKSFIFTREVSNVGEVEVEIPSKKEFVDYKRRITEAIEIISLAESAKPHQIVQSISRPNVDILGFRYSGEELRDGTISLEDALRIRTARKQLLPVPARAPCAYSPIRATAAVNVLQMNLLARNWISCFGFVCCGEGNHLTNAPPCLVS